MFECIFGLVISIILLIVDALLAYNLVSKIVTRRRVMKNMQIERIVESSNTDEIHFNEIK